MRKRRRVKIKKNKNKKARKPKWLYIVVFIAIVFVIVFLFLSRSVWKKDSKLVFVIGNELSGNSIFVLDPTSDSISETLIPHSLWLDSAYGLGDWKLGSLWQHGRNEKLGGKLVSESLTKNLYIPVYAWIYSDNNIHDKSYFSLLKTLMTSKDTNLTIRDRIRTAYFLASKSKKEIIDTGNFFEQSDKLENGTFTLSGRYTPKIGPYVFDEYTKGDTRIVIFDLMGEYYDLNRVNNVLETMGMKVSYIRKLDAQEFRCNIKGEKDLTYLLEKVFDCSHLSEKPDGNFDIELQLGKSFARDF